MRVGVAAMRRVLLRRASDDPFLARGSACARHSRGVCVLLSEMFVKANEAKLATLSQTHDVQVVQLPMQQNVSKYLSADTKNVLSDDDLARIDCGYASSDCENNWDTILCLLGALERSPKMRWLQIGWTGVDFPFLRPLLNTYSETKPFVVTNGAGVNAEPVATSVMGGIIMLHRQMHMLMRAQLNKRWLNKGEIPERDDLPGKRVLIFGFGTIGRQIACYCKSFGLDAVGVKRGAPTEEDLSLVSKVIHPDALERHVANADFVVISAPLTEQTRGVFGRDLLRRMKPSAYLLNVGRAAVVDESALVECLRERRIQGAYLDVFATEPLPPTHPLWELPNVIVSPHDAQTSTANPQRADAIFFRNLELFADDPDSRGAPAGLINVAWPHL